MPNLLRRDFLGAAAAAAAVASLAPGSAGAVTAAIPNRSGLPWRSGCATDVSPLNFEQYRGRKIDVRTTFWKKATWAGLRRLDGLVGPAGKLFPIGTGNREVVLITYYIFPDEQSPKKGGPDVWKMAARGEFDEHHEAIAAAISRYQGPFIFRVGHEWNGTSFPWGVTDPQLAPYYKDYFRRTVDILRKHNPGCMIDWCCLKRGQATAGIQAFYPGGDWVDFVGHDRYDRYPTFPTQAAWDKSYDETRLGGPAGIGAWLAYAKSEGRKLSVAEWGVVGPEVGGSGDNPVFVEKMLKFFRANAADVGFECYFNRNLGGGWSPMLQDNPRAGATYRQLMATGGA